MWPSVVWALMVLDDGGRCCIFGHGHCKRS